MMFEQVAESVESVLRQIAECETNLTGLKERMSSMEKTFLKLQEDQQSERLAEELAGYSDSMKTDREFARIVEMESLTHAFNALESEISEQEYWLGVLEFRAREARRANHTDSIAPTRSASLHFVRNSCSLPPTGLGLI